jgi:hypothetical protein
MKGDPGFVRGLCCNRCNLGLGLFLDSPNRLRLATAYLENHEQDQCILNLCLP